MLTSATMALRSRTFALEHLLAAEGEELAREGGGAVGRLLDHLDAAAHRVVGLEPAEDQVGAAGDDREQVVEVVRDAARQAAHRLHLLGLPELFLEPEALGDVHHRADHPRGPAVPVVQHVAAVEDAGVRAVGAAAAILRAPALGAALHRRVDVALHALAIVRMDRLVPPRDVRADLLRGVAEQGAHALVPPQRIAHEIPVPHRVVGGARDELEALLALPQRPDQPLGGAAGDLLGLEDLGVADRDGGLRGQPHQDRLVLVGERAGRAVVDVEQALDAVVDQDRYHHLGDDPERGHLPLVVAADPRVAEVVVRPYRPALPEREAAEPLAGLDTDAGQVGVPRGRPVAQQHRVGVGDPQADHRAVAAAELLRGLGDPAQHGGELGRSSDRAGQVGEHLRLAPPPLLLREEPGVLEGDRGLVRQRFGELHRARVEDGAGRGAYREHADEPVLREQRHREDGPVGLLIHVRAQGRGNIHPRVREDVRARDGAALAHGEADRARTGLAHRTPARGRRRGPVRHRHREQVRGVVVEPVDDRGATAQQGAEALGDAPADHVGVEPLGQQPADAGEGPGLLQARALLLEQARVLLLEPAQAGMERRLILHRRAALGAHGWHPVLRQQGPRHRQVAEIWAHPERWQAQTVSP